MDKELNKPLYTLTIGEFVNLMESTIKKSENQSPQNNQTEQEELFTIDQLASFLNCSKVTIHNYKKLGLPYFRIGRKILFKKSEVLEFMRKNVKRFFGGK